MKHMNPNMVKQVLMGIEDGERAVYLPDDEQEMQRNIIELRRLRIHDQMVESRASKPTFKQDSELAYYEGWIAGYRTQSVLAH
jgi:hypothetical protein